MIDFSPLSEFQRVFIKLLERYGIDYESLTNDWDTEQETCIWSVDYASSWAMGQMKDLANLIHYINNFQNLLKDKLKPLDNQIFETLCMIRAMVMNYNDFFDGLAKDVYKLITEYYHSVIAPLQYSVRLENVLTLPQISISNDNSFEILRLSILDFMIRIKGELGRNELLTGTWDDQARCYTWMLDYSMNWRSIHEYYYSGLVQNMNRFIMISDSRDKKLEIICLSELYYFLVKLHQFLYCDLLSDLDRLIKIHKNLNPTI